MLTTVFQLLRAVVLAVAFLITTSPVEAAPWRTEPSHAATGHTLPSNDPDAPRGDPVAGVIMIAGAVAVFVFLAWLAVRIGDSDRPADKIPN